MSSFAVPSATSVLSLPGKTFLAGEYLAIHGEPCLLLASSPRFAMRTRKTLRPQTNPFHPDSPAGKYWEDHQTTFTNLELEFIDPQGGAGGLGGSTAEFIFLYAIQNQSIIDVRAAWSTYRRYCSAGSGTSGSLPSGADLVAQIAGELTLFDQKKDLIETLSWPFADLGLLLVRTNVKLATHTHLRDLTAFSQTKLLASMRQIQSAVTEKNSAAFCGGINSYADALDELGFLAGSTRDLLAQLQHPQLLAKKGCGAMGADVIALFYRKSPSARAEIAARLEALNLKIFADETSVSSGLSMYSEDAFSVQVSVTM